MNAGGKGANQAVAAARLLGHVVFVAKLGDDLFGKNAVEGFKKENINTEFVFTDYLNASGIALINVDKKGENCIAVASGANANLNKDDIDNARSVIEAADIILLQLEIPLATVEYVITIASRLNKIIILNPAPAAALSDVVYQNLSFITPNENEAHLLSGIKVNDVSSAQKSAQFFIDKGVQNAIITLGKEGALWCNKDGCQLISSPNVRVVDTTAAGDVFNGALAVAISEKKGIKEAVAFANYSAALSVTKLGAQASAPHRNKVETFIQQSTSSF